MPVRFSEKFIAYLALLSGLTITVVAEYYSILGLTAIFSAAALPVIIMGIALGIGKITATVWLKQNWDIAPWSIRAYLLSAIAVLMLITSMGIFGFLSKAHSDQSLVSGDVQSKIAIYDEKIKTARENIEASRRQLKQMDDAVDQVMARSTDEKGADKSNAIRRSQQRDRAALAKDIEANQKLIAALNDEAAPIRAEVRKVEAEVGPIKYIANFVYGEAEQNLLEKAVTWVIIILIIVFDPLAVILLLSSQISFQDFREREQNLKFAEWTEDDFEEISKDAWVADVGEKPTAEELKDDLFPTYEEITPKVESTEGDSPEKESDIVSTATVTEPAPHHPDTHPYLRQGFKYPENWESVGPMVYKPDFVDQRLSLDEILKIEEKVERTDPTPPGWMYQDVPKQEAESTSTYKILPELQEELDKQDSGLFVQNEEQKESNMWSKTAQAISQEDYLNISQERLEQQVNFYASLLRNKQIDPREIPEPLLPLVKSRV